MREFNRDYPHRVLVFVEGRRWEPGRKRRVALNSLHFEQLGKRYCAKTRRFVKCCVQDFERIPGAVFLLVGGAGETDLRAIILHFNERL